MLRPHCDGKKSQWMEIDCARVSQYVAIEDSDWSETIQYDPGLTLRQHMNIVTIASPLLLCGVNVVSPPQWC